MDEQPMTDPELDSVRDFLTHGRDKLGKTDESMWPVPRLLAEVHRLRRQLEDADELLAEMERAGTLPLYLMGDDGRFNRGWRPEHGRTTPLLPPAPLEERDE